jgi:hypothetical protein
MAANEAKDYGVVDEVLEKLKAKDVMEDEE